MSLIAPFVGETDYSQLRRIDGVLKWVMCTQAVGVMCANHADPSIPVSVAETIRLYKAGPHGSNGGTIMPQFLTGLQAAYHHQPEAIHSYADALTHLRDDYRLAVAGNYHLLPLGSLGFIDMAFHLNPEAWHEVAVGPINPNDMALDDPRVWWADPLGPQQPGYVGEWIRWSVVRDHFALSSGDILAFPKGGWAGMKLGPSTRRSGTVTLLDAAGNPASSLAGADSRIRAFDLATGEHLALDTATPSVFADSSVGPGQVTAAYSNKVAEAVWIILCRGRLAALLARNAGPLQGAGDGFAFSTTISVPIKGVVDPDGTVTIGG